MTLVNFILLVNEPTDTQLFWLDMNQDSTLNVQDVVILINYILGDVYDPNGDLNGDGILNVQDVVILINIILD